MHSSLIDMTAPEGALTATRLSDLSFGGARGLPRANWEPPRHSLMAAERQVEPSADDLAELAEAWAPTVRMGL